MNKKSQISIFIILALIIVFLIIFLVNSNVEFKINEIEKDKGEITSENNQKIFLVKTSVDYCLEKQLQRALIISGLKGGFIYDKGEYYFPGTIPENTYSERFLSNLDLNWNSLQDKVLVHSQSQIYTPGIDSRDEPYIHSIKQDYIEFISIEFMKCLDFEGALESYDIDYFDYLGNVESFDLSKNTIIASNLDAKKGDFIKINDLGIDIIGVVNKQVSQNSYLVDFSTLSFISSLNADFVKNLTVINLNNSLDLNLIFGDENVRANINYPILINSNNFSSVYKDSQVVVDVRFGKLLELSGELLKYKNFIKRDASYTNNLDIIAALNDSNYFKKNGIENFRIEVKVYNETLENKKYVYSIIDYNSLIMGNSFVFNFGYQNDAPVINFSGISNNLEINDKENTIILYTSKNSLLKFALEPKTTEYQFNDHFIKYFIEQQYFGADAKFSLDSKGNLSFIAYREKVYNYDIEVTDGEATRKHRLTIITGFPDNTNNSAAFDCFLYRNYEDILYPIDTNYLNKIFRFVDTNGYNILYGYSITPPVGSSVLIRPSQLHFSKACVFNPDQFIAQAKITVGTNSPYIISDIFEDDNDGLIDISNSDSLIKVEVSVKDRVNGNSMTEPFVFNIYPVNCLGPKIQSFPGTSSSFTCCDLNTINANIAAKNPKSLVGTNSNIYDFSDNKYALNDDFYFAVDLDYVDRDLYDYQEKIIWDDFGADITSLFEGKLVSRCRGIYPTSEMNLEDINSGSKNLGRVESISKGLRDDMSAMYPDSLFMRLNVVQPGSSCNFGYITNITLKFNLVNGLSVVGGFKSRNSDFGLSFIPDEDKYDDLLVLCDNNFLVTKNNGINWVNSIPTGSRDLLYASKGYCSQGSALCKPRTGLNSRDDRGTSCTDFYFNSNYQSIVQCAPGQTCGPTFNCIDP